MRISPEEGGGEEIFLFLPKKPVQKRGERDKKPVAPAVSANGTASVVNM